MEKNNSIYIEEIQLGMFSRIFGIFVFPAKVFRYLRENPSWLLPLIVLFSLTTVNQILTMDIKRTERIEHVRENPEFSQERKDSIIDGIEKRTSPLFQYSRLLLTPIEIILVLIIISAFLFLFGNIFLSKNGKFIQVFSMFTYSSLLIIPASLVKTPLILWQNSSNVRISLNHLINEMPENSLFYNLLFRIDLFELWQVILVALGMSIIYKSRFVKGIIIVGIIWIGYMAAEFYIHQFINTLGI